MPRLGRRLRVLPPQRAAPAPPDRRERRARAVPDGLRALPVDPARGVPRGRSPGGARRPRQPGSRGRLSRALTRTARAPPRRLPPPARLRPAVGVELPDGGGAPDLLRAPRGPAGRRPGGPSAVPPHPVRLPASPGPRLPGGVRVARLPGPRARRRARSASGAGPARRGATRPAATRPSGSSRRWAGWARGTRHSPFFPGAAPRRPSSLSSGSPRGRSSQSAGPSICRSSTWGRTSCRFSGTRCSSRPASSPSSSHPGPTCARDGRGTSPRRRPPSSGSCACCSSS